MYHNYIESHIIQLVLSSVHSKSEAFKYYYQNKARLYLDEYPEQKELRINWFGKHHDKFKHIYTRFLRRD